MAENSNPRESKISVGIGFDRQNRNAASFNSRKVAHQTHHGYREWNSLCFCLLLNHFFCTFCIHRTWQKQNFVDRYSGAWKPVEFPAKCDILVKITPLVYMLLNEPRLAIFRRSAYLKLEFNRPAHCWVRKIVNFRTKMRCHFRELH